MTMPNESKMLERVRKWRREVFEADVKRSQHERDENTSDLAQRFGLQKREPASRSADRRGSVRNTTCSE
jgi:hypothetical protein